MRVITFRPPMASALHVGTVNGDDVIDLTLVKHTGKQNRREVRSVKQLLASAELMAECTAYSESAAADYSLSDITLERPLPDPTRVFCIGVNYMHRNEEYRDDSQAPEYPSIFMRSGFSLVAHEQALVIPVESTQFDYEGEIVLVIGKPGRRISQSRAHEHIAGITIMNEGSVRDWLHHGKFNVTQGKNFDRSGSLGPWMETDLSRLKLTDMTLETRVNGELRQKDSTASMAFPFARIIEYISTFTELQSGDIIATGTPTGAGARFDPPRWLVAGDVVSVSVEGIGTLSNRVEDE